MTIFPVGIHVLFIIFYFFYLNVQITSYHYTKLQLLRFQRPKSPSAAVRPHELRELSSEVPVVVVVVKLQLFTVKGCKVDIELLQLVMFRCKMYLHLSKTFMCTM